MRVEQKAHDAATTDEWMDAGDRLRIPLAPDAICGIVAVMIELSEVIASLRSELDAARREGTGKDLRFELGPVELEVSVAVEKTAGGAARVKFWVEELGADGKISSTSTQRIKLTLNPRLTEAAAAADTTALSERSAFVHGAEVDGEK
jgi:hypothetical protein